MKVGVFAPFVSSYGTPAFIADAARLAEQLGFDSIWVPEHVLLFEEYVSRYPYTSDGRIRIGPEGGVLEPFNALSFIAGATSTIRLGTGICLIPQRNPVYTAKEAATVDYLSNGRLDLGVGIGWLAEEFAALQVPWKKRAQRTRSYLEVMKHLWCGDVSPYKDEFYDLPGSKQHPVPVQQPHPPIHFGGESDAALERTADIGQGWFGFGLDPNQAAERIAHLHMLLAARGRKSSDIVVSIAPNAPGVDAAVVQRYAAAGVDQLIMAGWGRTAEAFRDSYERLAGGVVEPGHALPA
jgi:probable F420-dependent oxidoreductase